ncbi:hypothetical protein ACI3K5_24020 [Streptomyces sp. MPA0124]|uniref:hypothetical protein n=1 Tax=Streptomyces sp. MPA0124 TaxID=3378069 RepID=UPI00385354D1
MSEGQAKRRPLRIDLAGQVFGRLTVLEEAGRQGGQVLWLCQCSCGATTRVTTGNLRGSTTSCGCARRELAKRMNTIHGQADTLLFRRWAAMVNRVTNPKAERYADYGGRGITITPRWLKLNGRGFINFHNDMGAGFQPNLTLDRIDVNGPYSPENCRWATAKTQARNTRRNRYLTLWNQTKTLAEWCELLDLSYDKAKRRLQRGWTVERTLTDDCGAAEVWNRLFKVGTPVRVFPNTREDPPRITRTRTRAVQVQHGLAVVYVDGCRGDFDTRYIDPLPDNHPVEA